MKSIKVFKSGAPISANARLASLDTATKNGYDVYYLYTEFIKMFGPKAVYESIDSFYKDMFLYCINLGDNIRLDDDYGVKEKPEQRSVGFLSAASIDLIIQLDSACTDELILHTQAYYDISCSFNSYGELIENE